MQTSRGARWLLCPSGFPLRRIDFNRDIFALSTTTLAALKVAAGIDRSSFHESDRESIISSRALAKRGKSTGLSSCGPKVQSFYQPSPEEAEGLRRAGLCVPHAILRSVGPTNLGGTSIESEWPALQALFISEIPIPGRRRPLDAFGPGWWNDWAFGLQEYERLDRRTYHLFDAFFLKLRIFKTDASGEHARAG